MTVLEHSREPLRPVVAGRAALDECLTALSNTAGPVAFDAERAHGHRYWPKAYLFQIRRGDAGTWLIDPIAFEDSPGALGALVDACGAETTWIIHAASQDLPSMREVGLYPPRLFDTELAARLLGEPSAGLGNLLEAKLDIKLRKAHSAANWATRPLPENWLTYAALDVDYLAELQEVLAQELESSGRDGWAQQEFDDILQRFDRDPVVPAEPWRRLSGITSLKQPRQLAVARALWLERDALARERDRTPSRFLTDAAIVALASRVEAKGPLPGPPQLDGTPGFQARQAKRFRSNWLRAVASVGDLPSSAMPDRYPPSSGIGHPRSWERRHPEAAAAWKSVKPAIDELGCDLGFQPSLVAPPAIIQHVVYHHHAGGDLTAALHDAGARPWQVEFLAPLLEEHLR